MPKQPTNLTRFHILVAFSVLTVFSNAHVQDKSAETKITYDEHVKPILMQRCSTCHSSERKEGDFDAINFTNLMLGGGSGEVISPGSADESYLYQLITHAESPKMPPGGSKIPDQEIKTIADWINRGALENAGSKPLTSKPKPELTLGEVVTKRPETIPFPLRLPLEPEVTSSRPSVTAIATSPWAHLVAIGSPKQILLYDTQSMELIGVLPMPEGTPHALRFSRNGGLLIAGGGVAGQSGQTILWDVTTGARIASIGNEVDTVLATDISSDHKMVALGGPKKLVRVFSTADANLVYEVTKHTDWITAVGFSPDGKYLATGDRNGGLIVWESDTGNELFVLKGHQDSIASVSWRADSKVLASASEDMTVRIWEMEKGRQIKTWNAHAEGVTSMEFRRNGNIATSGRDKLAKTWDQNGKLVKEFSGLSDVAVAICSCDETNRILSADWSGLLMVWNATDAVAVGKLAANPPLLAERLRDAEQALSAARERYSPLATQLEQTQSRLNEASNALASVTQTRSQKESEIDEQDLQLAELKRQIESNIIQMEKWQAELTQKTKAQPLIEQTFTKAQEASNALPADEEMKKSVDQLKLKSKQIDSRISELQNLIEIAAEEKDSFKSKIDGITTNLQSSRQELEDVKSDASKLESSHLQLVEQVENESTATAKAEQAVASAQRMADKWKGEINFIKQLESLNGQLGDLEKVGQGHQQLVDQATEKLDAAQRVVDEAKQRRQAIQAQSDELQRKILQLRGGG